jgi:hypothetical protein
VEEDSPVATSSTDIDYCSDAKAALYHLAVLMDTTLTAVPAFAVLVGLVLPQLFAANAAFAPDQFVLTQLLAARPTPAAEQSVSMEPTKWHEPVAPPLVHLRKY